MWEPECDTGGEFGTALSPGCPTDGANETCLLGLKPEVYFKPQEVWEIRGAE